LRGGSSVDERRAHIRPSVNGLTSVRVEQKKIYCEVEQLVARRAHNPKVVRSSRALATKKRVVSFGNSFLFYGVLTLARRAHIRPSADGLTSVPVGPSLKKNMSHYPSFFIG